MILDRKEIILSSAQLKMLKSAWGDESIDNSKVEKITYLSDGLKVKGFIAQPLDRPDNKKLPCVIWNRGGFQNQGAIDDFTGRGLFGQIASWGYAVFASQYRGNAGGEGKDEFGGSDVNDILNLIPLADEVPFADKTLWAMEGWSRGGMMTYLTLLRNSSFKAAIVSGGIANLRCNADESKFMRMLYEASFGKYNSEDFEKLCFDRSAVNFASKLPKNVPILMLHAALDERVSPKDSLELSYKFLENNIPFRLVLLEGGDHYLRVHKKEVDRMRKQWLQKFLH
ncbi:MAG: prolyl oligopeptidase family serine peptidase [Bacteroidota bacterium]|nr:prolyl oligopeptidase family serine peptidase [Bacteroidota bacterium]